LEDIDFGVPRVIHLSEIGEVNLCDFVGHLV
jgi:hypothetical protein